MASVVVATIEAIDSDSFQCKRNHLSLLQTELPDLMVSNRLQSWARHVLLLWLVGCYWCVLAQEEEVDADEAMKQARLIAKPWYTHLVSIGGYTLPFSYTTAIIVTLTSIYVYGFTFGAPDRIYAEASHILLEDQSEETIKKMEGWKKKIGSNATLFAEYAKENSACPSKRNGGRLGKFPKGRMAAPFDRAIFDPKQPVGTTIGPIQTQFGVHLIFIHDRKL